MKRAVGMLFGVCLSTATFAADTVVTFVGCPIYRDTDQPERLLAVLNRMLLVAPDAAAELRDRGIVYQRLECYRAALKDLTDYLEREPDAPDLDDVRASLVDLSERCARLN